MHLHTAPRGVTRNLAYAQWMWLRQEGNLSACPRKSSRVVRLEVLPARGTGEETKAPFRVQCHFSGKLLYFPVY